MKVLIQKMRAFLRKTTVSILILSTLVKHCLSVCQIGADIYTINTATTMFFNFAPTNPWRTDKFEGKQPLSNCLDKVIFVIPAYFGITWSSGTCTKAGLDPGIFNVDTPICSVVTGVDGALTVSVGNLNPGSGINQPMNYWVKYPGFMMGPASKQNSIDESIGQQSNVECSSYTTTGALIEKLYVNTQTFNIAAITCGSGQGNGISVTGVPAMNSQSSDVTITVVLTQPIPVSGSLVLKLPKQNADYAALGVYGPTSYIQLQSLTAVGSLSVGLQKVGLSTSTNPLDAIKVTYTQSPSKDTVKCQFSNTAIIPSNSVLTVTISKLTLPGSLHPQDGLEVSTGDKYATDLSNGYIQYCPTVTLTNTAAANDAIPTTQPTAKIVGEKGVLASGVMYQFTIMTAGDIPINGYYSLTIPAGVGVPANPATDMAFNCIENCGTGVPTKTWDASSRTLNIKGMFVGSRDYLYGGRYIIFTLSPFVNPSSADKMYFTWASYAILTQGTYAIDLFKTMYVQAEMGTCTVNQFYPTDANNYIYGLASSWTFIMTCSHQIGSDFGLSIVFPSGFYIKDSSQCILGLQSKVYSCRASKDTKTITLTKFPIVPINALTPFTFTIDSIQNPPTTSITGNIVATTLTASGGPIDIGLYAITADFFKRGIIKKFTVEPQQLGVGQFPADYKFTIQPNGEVWMGSYFQITLPSDVEFSDERAIERKCDYNVTGFYFLSSSLKCDVSGKVVKVQNGFLFQDTQNMTNKGDTFIPPTFSFTLPAFRNPSSTAPSSYFDLTIYDKNNQALYTWDPKNTTLALTNNGVMFSSVQTGIYYGPVVQAYSAATPQAIVVTSDSYITGNTTNYYFTITPTNYVFQGDIINIKFPASVLKFSANSTCSGKSKNISPEQKCLVAANLTAITITLQVSGSRLLQAAATISPSDPFKIMISGVQNPNSLMQTPTMEYYLYSKGSLVEQQTSGLSVTMKTPGTMNILLCSVVPSNFIQSQPANYTLEFQPSNYQPNMKVTVTLPAQIKLNSNQTNCYGLKGTDAVNLDCQTDTAKKTITVTNAFTYQQQNPKTVRIMFETLTNPATNIMTSSFLLQTFNPQGYLLDSVTTGLVVNFYCFYPCASCNKANPQKCFSCYGGTSQYQIWNDFQCITECPVGFTDTTTKNCTACLDPCTKCNGLPTNCTSCKEGSQLIQSLEALGECREIVYWPFPFFASGLIFFIAIISSEIKTKTESRFKEAFVALLAIPEIISWCTLCVFYYFKVGLLGAFTLAAAATLMYAVINFTHAIVHPRKMVPNSLYSYKMLAENYKCNTYFCRIISYAVSFKFSLILVSYLWVQPRFKGDYSALNWMQFNKFSLVWICLPYSAMMVACVYFLVTDGFFSYAGFLSLEVIAISTISTFLMFLDAFSVFRCQKIGKERDLAIKTGVDYESDDDKPVKPKVDKKVEKIRNKKDDQEEFGVYQNEKMKRQDEFEADQDRSESALIASNLGYLKQQQMDPETKRQLFMLEELARQMRDEKELLRLEREEIEQQRREALERKFEESNGFQRKKSHVAPQAINKVNNLTSLESGQNFYSKRDEFNLPTSRANESEIQKQRREELQESNAFQRKKSQITPLKEGPPQEQNRFQRKQSHVTPQTNNKVNNLTQEGFKQIQHQKNLTPLDSDQNFYSKREELNLPTKRENGSEQSDDYKPVDYSTKSPHNQSTFSGQKKFVPKLKFDQRFYERDQTLDQSASARKKTVELDQRFYQRDHTLDVLARQNTNEPVEDFEKERFQTKKDRHLTLDVKGKPSRQGGYQDFEGEMEDYEGVDPKSEGDDHEQIEETAAMPQPAQGQINYYRQLDGEADFWMQQVTPRAGGDSMIGLHDILATEQVMVLKKSALFDEGMMRASLKNEEDYLFRDDASYSQINMTRQLDNSEFYHQRSEAQMDILNKPSSRKSKQEFFQNDEAIFSRSSEREDKISKESFVEREAAIFGDMEDVVIKNGGDTFFIQKEHAVQGDAPGRRTHIDGDDEKYLKIADAAYSSINTPILREATPLEYFDRGKPSVADASDRQRSAIGTQQDFINKTLASQGSIPDTAKLDGVPELHFTQDEPDIDVLSNKNRSVTGTQQQKLVMTDASYDRQSNENRIAVGTQQEFIKRDDAHFGSGHMPEDLQCDERFFNGMEAVRGEDSKHGQLRQDTQQNQFLKVSAEFGKTDYSKQIGDSENFVAKSNMGREGGFVSGVGTKKTQSINFLNKSDAVFGQTDLPLKEWEEATNSGMKNSQINKSNPSQINRSDVPFARDSQVQFSNNEQYIKSDMGRRDSMPNIKSSKTGSHSNEIHIKSLKKVKQVQNDVVDQSGKSESSEGIVDHNVFNKDKRVASKDESFKDDVAKQRKLVVIYSDKSESSVEELMGDTPSNYNLANGRLDGKSLGLKAILKQAQQNSGVIINNRAPKSNTIGRQESMSRSRTRNNEAEERKFVNDLTGIQKSRDGGWGTINQPIGSNKVQVIGEDLSENEYTSGGQQRRRKTIKTNKTFTEPALGARNQSQNKTPIPQQTQDLGGKIKKNNFV